MMNKKVLVAAIVGGLFAGNAIAADTAVKLGTTAQGGTGAAYFAKELIISNSSSGLALGSAGNNTVLSWDAGYAFSEGEIRYARLECSNNVKLKAEGAPTVSTATTQIGAVNGANTNVLTFSLTAGATPVAANSVVSIKLTPSVTSLDPVNCTAALYDTPSQAQNGGDAGRLTASVRSGGFLGFTNALDLDTTARVATADVGANPSFSDFVATGPDTTAVAQPAKITYGPTNLSNYFSAYANANDVPLKQNGTDIAMSDMFNVGASTVVIEGDFTAAANSGGTYSGGALARVKLNGVAASALTATKATFPAVASLNDGVFSLERRSGAIIPAATYKVGLNLVPATTPSPYNLGSLTGADAGAIVRNGTELQAPLVQIPDGWVSRLALTNTSGVARPYTISVMDVNGVAVTTGTLTGTIPANGTKVIDDLKEVFTGSQRATLNVSVAGPNDAIQGLYQIVNPLSGSISNHVLVRPGQN